MADEQTTSIPDMPTSAPNWVVGVDGSPDATTALRWAVAMSAEAGGAVVPLTAWSVPLTIRLAATKRVLEVDRNGLRAEAEVAVADTIAELGADDEVEPPIVVEGDAADTLLERSAAGDRLVVGRRGVSGFRHRVLGSVSNSLATHAPGPVVVVPHGWSSGPVRRIVVGFDGSEHAAAAVRWALAVAPTDSTVEALIAVDVIPWMSPELAVDRYRDEFTHARDRITAALDELDPGARVAANVVEHGPRQAFGDAMVDADLVVVGPRGLGGAARAVLGSLSNWLLHEAPCPVAVIPTQSSG